MSPKSSSPKHDSNRIIIIFTAHGRSNQAQEKPPDGLHDDAVPVSKASLELEDLEQKEESNLSFRFPPQWGQLTTCSPLLEKQISSKTCSHSQHLYS
jgi:hypothetical protein